MSWEVGGATSEEITLVAPTLVKRKRVRILGQLPQFSTQSSSEISKHGSKK
jgi:hypothetical protein